MDISIDITKGEVPVAVIHLKGELDASNYQELINAARDIYRSGERQLLLDMSDTEYMSSSGLVALHSVALVMGGRDTPDYEAGWNVFHEMGNDIELGFQTQVKLYKPQAKVMRTLQKTGIDMFFEVYTDWQTAVASFGKE